MNTKVVDHVLTGCTGFVGSHLLARLLTDGEVGRVHALARPRRSETAVQRVERALKLAGCGGIDGTGRLSTVEAEITASQCGVADADMRRIRRPDAPLVFWHVAASLQWARGQRATVFAINVDGTRNAMALARKLNADLFVYMSTSYTCGSLDGLVPEAIHYPPRFNNVYEESKNAAEQYVSDEDDKGLRVLIVRPSIIVGTSHDYKACGSYTGLYGFLTELRRFKRMLGDSAEVVRFSANRNAVLSFIPIDHVITDAKGVVQAELASPRRRIYHITADTGPRLGEIADYIFEQTGLAGRIVLTDGGIVAPTPLERFFARRMEFFSGYVQSTRRFERSIDSPRALSLSEIKRFINSELGDLSEWNVRTPGMSTTHSGPDAGARQISEDATCQPQV